MKLSVLLADYLPEFGVTIKNEKEFETLGLVGSKTGGSKCTFIDSADFIENVPDDVVMVFTKEEYADMLLDEGRGVCITESPRLLFFKLHNAISQESFYARETFETQIGTGCSISELASVAETNIKIGNNVVIEEFVVIRENTVIGDNCIIRIGCKLGCPDFEFKREHNTIFGVKHIGGVRIGRNVEVLPNTGINKAIYPWDDTVVDDYCKIDMLCNISHGAKIGSNTMIVALSGIGGRTRVGENCWIGYGCILKNGITVGNNARVNMGSVVSKDVGEGQAVTGNFAIEHKKFIEDLKRRAK